MVSLEGEISNYMEAILFSLATFFSTFFGGLFGIRNREKLHLIISFTAGVILSVVFFDIIPEMFSIAAENNLDITNGLIAIIAGFFLIHIFEKAAVIHSAHEHEYEKHHHPLVGYISASGLSVHSFLDGIGIGLGFHVNAHIGTLIAFAVIAHDFCDGLNTVSVMLMNKHKVSKALTLLLVDAVAPVLGVLSTFIFDIPHSILMLYLGVFAGFLLYLSASDLLPEAHSKKSSWHLIGLTIAGSLFIFIITRFI